MSSWQSKTPINNQARRGPDFMPRVRIDPRRARYIRFLLSLLTTSVLLLLCGASALAAYALLENSTPEPPPTLQLHPPEDPTTLVVIDEVIADLALRELTSEDPVMLIQEMISLDELHTAYAALVHNPILPDDRRAGLALLLGERLIQAEDPERALACIAIADDIAHLSISLPDRQRADLLLQVSRWWARVGDVERTDTVLSGALHLIDGSTTLLPSQRFALLERAAATIAQRGDLRRAAELRRQALESPSRPARPAPPVFPELIASPPPDAQVADVARQRRGVALETYNEWPDVDLDILADLLVDEDEARAAYLLRVEGSPNPREEAATLQAHAEWLHLNYRIASLRFNLDIVPEWVAEADNVRFELAETYDDFFELLLEEAARLPDLARSRQAQREVLQQQVLSARLGLYPDPPLDYLMEQLEAALQADPPVGARLDLRREAEPRIEFAFTRP